MKLFTAIHDDARLLGHFLAHYTQNGITEFFIATAAEQTVSFNRYAESFRITVFEGLDVADSWYGGSSAISEMRRKHQGADEWVVIADLDEFIEFVPDLRNVILIADGEGANVVRGIMCDRFSINGALVDFEPESNLSELYPVKSRFTRDVMIGADRKGVLVKGQLQGRAQAGHHDFEGQRVCSLRLEISHYKWNARALNRVRLAHQQLSQAGKPWAIEYKRVLDHFEKHGRFAWEHFGGQLGSVSLMDSGDI